jgi:sterol desaturase/sphingolipid hydroxylase (fatty acid hydroxylase superfamily)
MKGNETHKMFQNPILEFLSISGPKMMVSFHLIVASSLIYIGIQKLPQVNLSHGILLFFSGMLLWTLMEYILHRYLFHWITENKYVKAFHYAMHGYHHKKPNDYNRLFMPPVPVSLFILSFFGLFYLFMGQYTWFFLPGFEIGYLMYSLVHYAAHTKPAIPFLAPLFLHHDLHHFRFPDKAFGVSSRFWDRVFGTMPDLKK